MNEIIKFNTDESSQPQIETIDIFELVSEDDPILREVLPEFDFANAPINPADFASTMVETCRIKKGLGLSANQCGFRYRMFVMGNNNDYVAFFNPKIIEASTETVHMVEGCLSFPWLELKITRPAGIVVEYQDYNGETKRTNYVGLTARCFLHELDHLNGIVYTDRAKPVALTFGKKKREKMQRLMKKAEKSMEQFT